MKNNSESTTGASNNQDTCTRDFDNNIQDDSVYELCNAPESPMNTGQLIYHYATSEDTSEQYL